MMMSEHIILDII